MITYLKFSNVLLTKISAALVLVAGVLFLNTASALGVHGGLKYFFDKGDPAVTLTFTAKQIDEAGNAIGARTVKNHSSGNKFSGTVKCLFELQEGLYVLWGTSKKNSDNPFEANVWFNAVLKRDKGEPDAATAYIFPVDLGSCENVRAAIDTFPVEVFIEDALSYEESFGPAVGNVAVTPKRKDITN